MPDEKGAPAVNVYRVVGVTTVCGVAPGGRLTEKQIRENGAKVEHLISAGAITPTSAPKSAENQTEESDRE